MAEFSAGLQKRQKYIIFAFLTSSGGKFYEFFMTFVLAIPPLTVNNRPCALNWACALNRKNTVNVSIFSPLTLSNSVAPCL